MRARERKQKSYPNNKILVEYISQIYSFQGQTSSCHHPVFHSPFPGEGQAPRRGEGPSRTLNRGEDSLPGSDPSGSAMEWRGVGDKPAKKRGARLLLKEEQPLYSGCVKALPLAYSGLCKQEKLGVVSKHLLRGSIFPLGLRFPFHELLKFFQLK